MKISPARMAAFDVLLRIETEGAFSSALLPSYEASLIPADRNLCHEIVLGVLRRKLYLDRLIALASGSKKTDPEVRVALWMGIYQIIFLDRIPAHSAINDSVELVGRAKKRSAKGFVNAVLRRITREVPDVEFSDPMEEVSVMTSHPRWLIERWAREFGNETAAAIAEVNNEVPPLCFRLLSDGIDVMASWRPSKSVPGAYSVESFDGTLRRLAEEDKVYFQDEASQLVAASVPIPSGGSFLDVCAAPGGKVGSIARMQKPGISVCGDLHGSRVRFLKDNLLRQGLSDSAVLRYDAEVGLPFGAESFDAVLVDAPCSGTGTIRHNPEIRYSVTEQDISSLTQKQHGILSNASNVVKVGGSLVYSTCSLEREEGEDVAASFLAKHPEYVLERPKVPGRLITAEGFARTWPHRDGMDGFFIAAFRRSS